MKAKKGTQEGGEATKVSGRWEFKLICETTLQHGQVASLLFMLALSPKSSET